MFTVSKAWTMMSKIICQCEHCQKSHKTTFFSGARAFMEGLQQLDDGKTVDIGPFIDAQTVEFEAHLAECGRRSATTVHH
jgi:hypothetical protein